MIAERRVDGKGAGEIAWDRSVVWGVVRVAETNVLTNWNAHGEGARAWRCFSQGEGLRALGRAGYGYGSPPVWAGMGARGWAGGVGAGG